MKNRLFVISIVMILMLAIVGCSSEAPVENTEGNDSQQETTFDDSLDGLNLLKSISGERPDSLKMKMEMMSSGMSTVTTVYYSGDNSRTETVVEGMGTSVLIYNADEETMYSYVEGTGQGIKIIGADIGSAEEAGLMLDMSTKFSELSQDMPENVIARTEKLGEEEVVYIEVNEMDKEMGEILVKMWYSVDYNVPLKYEIFTGEEQVMSLNVSEIEKNIKADKEMFEAPSDITFQDVEMDAMMGDYM